MIFGGGWAGNSSLSLSSSSRNSGSGWVWRVSRSSRPSVVGICTSIICRAANFSNTLRGVRPGAKACKSPPQCHVQAIGQKAIEDVGLDAVLVLMKDRPDGQITLEVLERFFHRAPIAGNSSTACAGSLSVRLVRKKYRPSRRRACRSLLRSSR